MSASTNSIYTANESVSGSYEVRMTVHYQTTSGPAIPDFVKTYSVYIIAPDTDIITSGLNVDHNAQDGADHQVVFHYAKGTKLIGAGSVTLAEEQIDNIFPTAGLQGWSGVYPNSPPFSWDSQNIYDDKAWGLPYQSFSQYNVGDTVKDMNQQNRITYINSIGDSVTVTFPAHRLTRKKSGTYTYKLIEQ